MSKRLRNEPIWLASQMHGYRDNNNPFVFDERTGETLDPCDINNRVLIYERQVKEWFLNRASELCNNENCDFIIMMIATAYIEGVEQYRNGESSNGRSEICFRNGMNRIFFTQHFEDYQLRKLYKHLRCGLFHNGMSGDAVVMNDSLLCAIDFPNREIIDINPRLFLDAIIHDFEKYLNELRDESNTELRDNFNRMFIVV